MSHILREEDAVEAREEIKKNKETGKKIEDEIKQLVKITSAGIVKLGHYSLDKNVLNAVESRVEAKKKAEMAKLKAKKAKYDVLCSKTDKLLTTKPIEKWTVSDYQTAIKPHKGIKDGKMPTKMEDLKKMYDILVWRPRLKFDIPDDTDVDDVIMQETSNEMQETSV